MVKPRGKIERHGYKPGVTGIPISDDGIHIAAWCPDKEAKRPPEQVHLMIHVVGLQHPLVMRFKSPDTLGFLIEELSRYRSHVWPDAEPIEFHTQFED